MDGYLASVPWPRVSGGEWRICGFAVSPTIDFGRVSNDKRRNPAPQPWINSNVDRAGQGEERTPTRRPDRKRELCLDRHRVACERVAICYVHARCRSECYDWWAMVTLVGLIGQLSPSSDAQLAQHQIEKKKKKKKKARFWCGHHEWDLSGICLVDRRI